MPPDNRKTGSDPDAVAFDALGRFGTPEQQHAFATAVARRQAVTDDHTHRISALESGVAAVVSRVAGVERTLSDMSSEAARSGASMQARVDTVGASLTAKIDAMASVVDGVAKKQITDTAFQAGVAQQMAASAAAAEKAAESRMQWLRPVYGIAIAALVGALGSLLALGVIQFVRDTARVPTQVEVEVGPAK